MGGLWVVLYGHDGRLALRVGEHLVTLGEDVTVVYRRAPAERTVEVRVRDEPLLEHRFGVRGRLLPEALATTPFLDLVSDDLLELAASFSADPDRRKGAADDWSRGFSF